MHVAVLGGGLAGLSSAIFLQQNGIHPHVYEARNELAGFPTRAEVLMPIYSKPLTDYFSYIKKNFGLTLRPHGELRRIIWHTRNASASAVGRLGFITLRGRAENSLDRQISFLFPGRVKMASSPSLQDLTEKYSWVIDATGQAGSCRPEPRSICFRGGTIRGRFEPETMHIWHTSEATPKGFAYLIPRSSTLANVFCVIPLPVKVSGERFFSVLWPLLCKDLGFEPDLVKSEEFRRAVSDNLPQIKDKVLYAGDSLGSAAPFLGIDQFFAVASAYYAVQEICGLPGYSLWLKKIEQHLHRMQVIRHAMDSWGDFIFDNLVRAMRFGATPFFVSKRNLLSAVSVLLCPYASFISKKNLFKSLQIM